VKRKAVDSYILVCTHAIHLRLDAQFNLSRLITNFASGKEIFSVLLGPRLTNRQFVRAIATASIVKPQIGNIKTGGFAAWNILDTDADWDALTPNSQACIKLSIDDEKVVRIVGTRD
jgi:hypothetical protein